jgi:hypothetical protein
MNIAFAGRTWQLDTSDIDMRQAETITGYAGLTLSGWEQSCLDHEGAGWLKSMRCLYWLMLAQNGQDEALADVNFAVLKFFLAWAEAAAGESKEAGAEPEDPTKPADGNVAEAPPLPQPISAG